MMDERDIATRVTTFQTWIEVISINCSLALHRKIKFRKLHRQLADWAQTRIYNRNSRQQLSYVMWTRRSADHLVSLKCKFSGNNETVRIRLMVGWVEHVAGFYRPTRLAVAPLLRSIQCLAPRSAACVERITNDLVCHFWFHLLQVHQKRHIGTPSSVSFWPAANSANITQSTPVIFPTKIAHSVFRGCRLLRQASQSAISFVGVVRSAFASAAMLMRLTFRSPRSTLPI